MKSRQDGLGLYKTTQDNGFYNCREKFIVDEAGELRCIQTMISEKAIFNPLKLEKSEEYAEKKRKKREEIAELLLQEEVENMTSALSDRIDAEKEKSLRASAQRAKRCVKDIVHANSDMTWFLTFTLNGEQFPRNDIKSATRKLNKYLANRVQRNGLKYVFVPELHSDGESIHFHGFVNDVLNFVPSGTYIPPNGGKPLKRETLRKKGINHEECNEVYNVACWKYGFSTAIKVYGDRGKASSYIAKYITKGLETGGKICGRFYFSGGDLIKPIYEYSNAVFIEGEGDYQIDEPYMKANIFNGKIDILGK